jgi:transposase
LRLFSILCASWAARGYDIAHLEQAVHAKLKEFTSPAANQQAREAGLAQARHLVEQVLAQIKAQGELKKSLTVADLSAPPSSNLRPIPFPSKLLN